MHGLRSHQDLGRRTRPLSTVAHSFLERILQSYQHKITRMIRSSAARNAVSKEKEKQKQKQKNRRKGSGWSELLGDVPNACGLGVQRCYLNADVLIYQLALAGGKFLQE